MTCRCSRCYHAAANASARARGSLEALRDAYAHVGLDDAANRVLVALAEARDELDNAVAEASGRVVP